MVSERKPYVSLNMDKRLEIEELFKSGYGIEETAAKVDISYTSLYRELVVWVAAWSLN